MRIIIDTELSRIIVPDAYYNNIDKMNAVLKRQGIEGKDIDYIKFVQEAFDKAIKEPLIRKEDIPRITTGGKGGRPRTKKDDN